MSTVIKVENISKQYRLGMVGSSTISDDLTRWWAGFRGKEDPFAKIGDTNDRTKIGNSEYVWALKDINFEVKQGEVLGIIGKNGAGKSTLLKILSKVTAPTTGIIKTKGRIASLLEVGTGFHPELSGRENIFLNGAVLGMKKAEIASKFDEIVAFSGVEKYIDTPVKRYSSGMYVRLAFAVAAHLEPEILIIDEVLAVGDAEFQKKCLGKMKDVAGQGRTVLFVSHNLQMLNKLCDKSILLENGKIKIAKSNTSDVIEKYLSEKNSYAGIDLKQRVDREGKGNIRITKVSIKPCNNNETQNIKAGDKAKLVFDYSTDSSIKEGDKVTFAFSFHRADESFISYLDSDVSNEISLTVSPKKQVECIIDNLNLSPNKYFINIVVIRHSTLQDWIDKAFAFEVLPSAFYETKLFPPSSHSGALMNYKWS